jgi:hypothetical protein
VRWEWPRTLAVSCIVFAAATAVLQHVVLPLLPLYLTVILALALARHLMPRYAAPASVVLPPPPHWDIPARMGVATAFVLILTGLAPALGPQLTGLLAPFPLYATILAIFAQHLQGPLSAIRVLRGLLLGLVAFATFFLVLAALLTRVGIAASFGAASTAALVLQVGTLWMLRRMAG